MWAAASERKVWERLPSDRAARAAGRASTANLHLVGRGGSAQGPGKLGRPGGRQVLPRGALAPRRGPGIPQTKGPSPLPGWELQGRTSSPSPLPEAPPPEPPLRPEVRAPGALPRAPDARPAPPRKERAPPPSALPAPPPPRHAQARALPAPRSPPPPGPSARRGRGRAQGGGAGAGSAGARPGLLGFGAEEAAPRPRAPRRQSRVRSPAGLGPGSEASQPREGCAEPAPSRRYRRRRRLQQVRRLRGGLAPGSPPPPRDPRAPPPGLRVAVGHPLRCGSGPK